MALLNNHLETWVSVNAFLPNATEEECQELLKMEKKGMKRRRIMLRIHSRLNKMRAHRERIEIAQKFA